MGERVCDFCANREGEGGRLFAGSRQPPSYICEECVTLLYEIAKEDRPISLSTPPPPLVPWTRFDFRGDALEWWAMRVNVPRKGVRLMVSVRKQGDDGDGVATLYAAGTAPSLALAEETATKLSELV